MVKAVTKGPTMKHDAMFTLAPADHERDPVELERGYKVWSTFKRNGDTMFVRSNNDTNAGGQTWSPIASKVNGLWYIEAGDGYFGQGGRLLAGWLKSLGVKFRSVMPPHGNVAYYTATSKAYSLPTILNGYKAVVNRDKLADERRKARRVDIAAAMAARKQA